MNKAELKNIFRMPTSKEMKDAFDGKNTMPSDYQLTNLSVFASIMLAFRMVTRVPRSKIITVADSTEVAVKKNISIISNILKRYDGNDSIDILFNNLKNTKCDMEKKFGGINLATVVKDAASFKSLTAINTLLPRIAPLVRGIYGSDAASISAREFNNVYAAINPSESDYKEPSVDNYEPSVKEVELTKKIYNELIVLFTELSKTDLKPKTWIKRLDDADTFNSIINGELLFEVKPAILSFKGTINEFEEAITNRLNAAKRPAEKKYAKAVIDDELIDSIVSLTEKMKKLGLEGGFTIGNLFEYIKKYDTDIILMLEQFGLTADMLNTETFPTFESLMKFFYEPERLYKATMALGVNFRSRESGVARKGAAVAVDARSINKCIKSREKKAAEQKEKYGQVNSELSDSIARLKADAANILNKVTDVHQGESNLDAILKLKEALITASEDEYYTTSFIIKSKNQNIINFVEKFVKNLFVRHEKYLNTASYEIDNRELGKNLTEIAIDYPKASKLKKAFSGESGYKMMVTVLNSIKAEIATKFEMNVPFIMDRDEIRLNMNESQAMKRGGDILDAWDAFCA